MKMDIYFFLYIIVIQDKVKNFDNEINEMIAKNKCFFIYAHMIIKYGYDLKKTSISIATNY